MLLVLAASGESREMVIEIHRVAPGKHGESLRRSALRDRANEEARLPPGQLFVRQGGAPRDVLILEPAHHADEENRRLDAAFREPGIPQGARFMASSRQLIAERTDAQVEATAAAQYLKKPD